MKILKPIVIPLIMPGIIFIIWTNSSFLELADFAWQDVLYTLRVLHKSDHSQAILNDVIIVAIDEPSFQQIQLRWPWPRSLHAKLVDKLSDAGAASIAIDILFPEQSDDKSEDIIFADAVKKAKNVVLASNLTITGRQGYETYFIEKPVPVLASAAADIGMVNFYPDGDGSVRMASNSFDMRHSISFAAVITALKKQNKTYLNQSPISNGTLSPDFANNARIKKEQLHPISLGATDDTDRFFIDYAGKTGTIPAVSYYQVINNMVAPELFKDKIVFVGFVTDAAVEVENGADSYPYPFMRFTKKMISGVEIQANVARTILKGYPIREFSMPAVKWFCFYILACIMIPVRKNPVYLSLSTLAALILTSFLSIMAFRYHGILIDITPAVAGITLNGMSIGIKEFVRNYREKSVLRKAFDSYVSPDIVASVIENHENLKLGGQRKRLSVLFSDIRGFTTLSENLSPEAMVSLLNNYFTRMTETVFKHNGTLDKYIGDAIMVIFGAPVWSDNHAENACYTALEMTLRLKDMNQENPTVHRIGNSIINKNHSKTVISSTKNTPEKWNFLLKKEGQKKNSSTVPPLQENSAQNTIPKLPHLAIGIGINTGEMIVGNMGSLRRFDYTVMGDEVNLASRLEGVTKIYGVQIIISEETQTDISSNKFLCRELDFIKVKGKNTAIKIYELVSTRPASEIDEIWVELFVKGLDIYRKSYQDNRWNDAIELFQKVLEYKKDDEPSKLFIDRCEMFKKHPPVENGEDWDGVWVMSTK